MKDAIVIVWCSNEFKGFWRYKVDQQILHEISTKMAIESHWFVYRTSDLVHMYDSFGHGELTGYFYVYNFFYVNNIASKGECLEYSDPSNKS